MLLKYFDFINNYINETNFKFREMSKEFIIFDY